MKGVVNQGVTRNCKICSTPLNSQHPRKMLCSKKCERINLNLQAQVKRKIKADQTFKDSVEGIDYVSCSVCGLKSTVISPIHIKSHGLSYAQYKNNNPVICSKAQKNRSEKMKGANNPAFNHGGKLSPFSKNFIKYSTRDEYEQGLSSCKAKSSQSARENGNNSCTLLYWLKKGYSEEDAKILLSERQTTFSLDICIQKYGDEEGRKVWGERQKKWKKTLDAKSDEEKIRINKAKMSHIGPVSKAELELLSEIQALGFNVEHQFVINRETGCFVYDFRFENRIIEYNGDYWHANPNIFKDPLQVLRSKRSVQSIWDRDALKLKTAQENGFEVLTIWESEYRNKKNKKKSLEKCKTFLTA